MGRLFWKFFAVFWLAQFVTFLAIGLLFIAQPPAPENLPISSPPAQLTSPNGPSPNEPRGPRGRLPPPPLLAAALVVSLGFAAGLSWYFSRPIRTLNAAFEALADGKLDTRVGVAMGARRDELSDLGLAFDRSAAKLEALVVAQRRLLHDVSHELRSPLARLQACSDLLIQQPQRAAELVQRIERETGRMDALVDELLTLARLDSGAQPMCTDRVDLSDLVRVLCIDVQLELESKACTLDLDVETAVSLQGDGELLYRALDNILRNAIRFAPAGSAVDVRLRKQAALRQATVHIADVGLGLPPQDLGTIFEPFYRSAHTALPQATAPVSGYGLGLAITRSIVQSHGGTVIAANRAGGGLEMQVTLPLGVS